MLNERITWYKKYLTWEDGGLKAKSMEDPSSLFELQAPLFELRPDKPTRQSNLTSRPDKPPDKQKSDKAGFMI